MPRYLSILVSMTAAVLICWTPVAAQKQSAQRAEDSYRNLIGTEFESELAIPGWESWGGGWMADSVWYQHLKRDDDAFLVLILWALPRKPGAIHAPFRVTDVLLIPPVPRNLTLVFDCRAPRKNVFEKIFAVVRFDDRREWWRDVRNAWKVDLSSGTITPVPTRGIACWNEGAGA